MRCRVYPLRHGGRRLPWREVVNAPSFEGELSTHYLSLPDARYFLAKLAAPGDALCKPLLPELYEPVLTSIGNGLMLLRGFEREGKRLQFKSGGANLLPSKRRRRLGE